MSDIRKKVSMLQVMADIKPYIVNMIAMMTKRFVENVLKKRTEKLNGRLLI